MHQSAGGTVGLLVSKVNHLSECCTFSSTSRPVRRSPFLQKCWRRSILFYSILKPPKRLNIKQCSQPYLSWISPMQPGAGSLHLFVPAHCDTAPAQQTQIWIHPIHKVQKHQWKSASKTANKQFGNSKEVKAHTAHRTFRWCSMIMSTLQSKSSLSSLCCVQGRYGSAIESVL